MARSSRWPWLALAALGLAVAFAARRAIYSFLQLAAFRGFGVWKLLVNISTGCWTLLVMHYLCCALLVINSGFWTLWVKQYIVVWTLLVMDSGFFTLVVRKCGFVRRVLGRRGEGTKQQTSPCCFIFLGGRPSKVTCVSGQYVQDVGFEQGSFQGRFWRRIIYLPILSRALGGGKTS